MRLASATILAALFWSASAAAQDRAEPRLREQETLVEAGGRRIRALAAQLDAREQGLTDQSRRLVDRERKLDAREQQLAARERRPGLPVAPAQPKRELEAQLAMEERKLAARERSLDAAIEAARGRERDAAGREDDERMELGRRVISLSDAGSPELDLRQLILGGRARQLSAAEARLGAWGERLDAQERQARVRGERLDVWQRRLEAASDRLDLEEKQAVEPRAAATLAAAPALSTGAIAAAAKGQAIFVLVAKTPTAIVKDPVAAAPAAGLAPAGAGLTAAAEKTVAAATVIAFPTTASQLSELDREAIDDIAKLAARERCELVLWARANGPPLMQEAQRRAAELRTRALSAAPLSERQIQTRITTRPGTTGVDVVVSALRESRPATPAAPVGATGMPSRQLGAGEAGKRQIREAMEAAQSSIEACVGSFMEQKRLPRAEGGIKVSVSSAGKVAKVLAADGDLAGAGVIECLASASAGWAFPGSDAGYVVEVPITVLRGAPR